MAMKFRRVVSQVAHLFLLYGLALCSELFPNDVLTPYTYRHGSGRFSRDVKNCKHVSWNNETYEVFKLNVEKPQFAAQIQVHKFADSVSDKSLPGNLTRYLRHTALGSIAFIDDPYFMLSVLEPREKGGCKPAYFSTTRSLVRDTVETRTGGCKVAINAGYFKVSTGDCLGNIVSDGRLVQTSGDEQNANFGIRQDGTIVVGYLPDSEIRNSSNPFRQLVTGVVWLVRNGSSFVNESIQLECSTHEDTGKMDVFASVLSARTAVGHDAKGRVVIVQVDGQTHRRGVSLWQFAELLISHGLVNAINLDGGGSSTFIYNGELTSYPSDHCRFDSSYRCERSVSTVLCAHEAECLEPQCSQHGSCDNGHCSCDLPWTGETCDKLNCSLTNCNNRGNCSEGVCSCGSGWMGSECNTSCPDDRFGSGCKGRCWCYGRSYCDNTTGACRCPPGYIGYSCWRECPVNKFGQDCLLNCSYPDCSGHGKCSPVNGSCLCTPSWSGPACNISLEDALDSLLDARKPLPTPSELTTPFTSMNSSLTSPQPSSTQQLVGNSPKEAQYTTVSPGNSPTKEPQLATVLPGNSPTKEPHATASPGNSHTKEPHATASPGNSHTKEPQLATVLPGNSPKVTSPPQNNIHPLRDSSLVENSPQTESHDDPQTESHDPQNTPPPSKECPVSSRATAGVLIAVSVLTVLVHIVLCVWTHQALYRRLGVLYDKWVCSILTRTSHKRRRKRRRRKQHFVPIAQDTSSDCSI